jgi:prephenate dehydrogenase
MAMQIALIGYGEVGSILAEDLRAQGVAVSRLRPQAGQCGG